VTDKSFHEVRGGRILHRSVHKAQQEDLQLWNFQRAELTPDDVEDIKARWRSHKLKRVGKSGRVFGFRESQRDFFESLDSQEGSRPAGGGEGVRHFGGHHPRYRSNPEGAGNSGLATGYVAAGGMCMAGGVRIMRFPSQEQRTPSSGSSSSPGASTDSEVSARQTWGRSSKMGSFAKRLFKKIGSGIKSASGLGKGTSRSL
jgi:hypothetical protein